MRILVATDFSVRSDRALRRASLIASKLDGRLTLAHIVEVDQPTTLIEANSAAAASRLEELARKCRDVDGIETDWLIHSDDVYTGILATAETATADLIVMGPHRARMTDVFVGTTVERVVRRSVRPLLVAVDAPTAHHRGTLLALDFDEASRFAARKALTMGVFDHTSVIVMHAFDAPAAGMMQRAMIPSNEIESYVNDEERAAVGKLADMRDQLALPPTSQIVAAMMGSPARTIRETARDSEVNLIVLGTNQRKGFERVLIGSVTADVIREAHCDVLIIPVDEPA